MITDKMTPLEKCIEWMRGGGETPRSVLLHQKIAKQAADQLQELEFSADRTKALEAEGKALKVENDQLRQQLKKKVEILNNTVSILEPK
jgi:cell shape-determining protein MreC